MKVVEEHPRHQASNLSLWAIIFLHVAPAIGLVAGIWVLPAFFGLSLVNHTLATLRLAMVLELIIVLLTYTFISGKHGISVWQAVGRGLLSLPIGAFIAAFGAIIFGAPLALEYSSKTLYWAQLLSVLSVLPTAIILGGSWSDWQRLFAFTKPKGAIEYSACIPAHGAIIGAWFGAWPMPLDWERPWQEWPVCVTYGMAVGFIIGSLFSLLLISLNIASTRSKKD